MTKTGIPKKKIYNRDLEFASTIDLVAKVEQAVDDLLKSPLPEGSAHIFSSDVASRVMDNENTLAVGTDMSCVRQARAAGACNADRQKESPPRAKVQESLD